MTTYSGCRPGTVYETVLANTKAGEKEEKQNYTEEWNTIKVKDRPAELVEESDCVEILVRG